MACINILKAKVSKGALKKTSNGLITASDLIQKEISENIFGSIYLQKRNISFNFYEIKEEETIDKTLNKIEEEIIRKNIEGIVGGNHVISYGTIKAFKRKYPDGKIIIFDAHPDVESDFFISHEDYLRNLINHNITQHDDIVLIGIRNASNNELNYLKQKRIIYFTALDLYDKERIKKIESILKNIKEPCFISLDVDVFDPCFAPGTGYIESFGISPFQFLEIVKRIKNLKMFDIVEINSEKDINNITINLAARIMYELSFMIRN